MRKKRFTEHQIIKVLKQVEGGRSASEVCREYGISQGTYYNWKAKYGAWKLQILEGLKI
jgi:putative transposase